MPRKTKETTVNEQANLNEKINNLIQSVLDSDDVVMSSNNTAKKTKAKPASTTKTKTSTAKTTKKKSSESSDKTKTSGTKAKTTSRKKSSESSDKTTTSSTKIKTSSRKNTEAKSEIKDEEKKSTKKTTSSAKVKTATKKVGKASTKSSTSTKSTSKTKSVKAASATVVEYYDLPYKYNQTVVKVLYQNPTTLFVYWEISDDDMEHYKSTYGENFFETTRPVLVVYNETMNYSFEVNINDFANSWYFNINDSKCNYRVELIRKLISYNEKIKTDYIYITSSNKIETPNDRILFSTNEPYTVYFKNTKNNTQRKVNLPKLLEDLNLVNKDFGFPIVQNVYDLYKHIYNIEDVGEFSISLTNPSSGNPSSHSLSSRFK